MRRTKKYLDDTGKKEFECLEEKLKKQNMERRNQNEISKLKRIEQQR